MISATEMPIYATIFFHQDENGLGSGEWRGMVYPTFKISECSVLSDFIFLEEK